MYWIGKLRAIGINQPVPRLFFANHGICMNIQIYHLITTFQRWVSNTFFCITKQEEFKSWNSTQIKTFVHIRRFSAFAIYAHWKRRFRSNFTQNETLLRALHFYRNINQLSSQTPTFWRFSQKESLYFLQKKTRSKTFRFPERKWGSGGFEDPSVKLM